MKPSFYIHGINGPVVQVKGERTLAMMDMVYVGEMRLIGEVVNLKNDCSVVQVYEDTVGLTPGEGVYATGSQMCIRDRSRCASEWKPPRRIMASMLLK